MANETAQHENTKRENTKLSLYTAFFVVSVFVVS